MDITRIDRGSRRFIATKAFYLFVLSVAVPIMIQNGISNFVNMLDNLMIGRIGTEQMSGASIVNQLIFVYNLCIFGGVSGAGIFTAQYFGQKNHEGVRQTFRYKIWLGTALSIAALVLFLIKGDALIGLYLKGEGTPEQIRQTLSYGKEYLQIMLLGLLPFMLTNVYASTLRECGETILPMRAGVAAVLVNLVFNYLLIYGKAGFPEMGVAGAAAATVLSRFIELSIIVIWTHRHPEKNPFVVGLYESLKVPAALVKKIVIKGTPLLINEALWSGGMAMLIQCYSVRGLNVVASHNIANTINNVFNIVFIALGDSVAIIVGQLLGAGKMEDARDADRKIITFSVMCCTAVAAVMLFVAPFFPRLYNTEEEVKALARSFIIVNAVAMPMYSFLHATYFTLRSGGKTIITFLFDSMFVWVVSVPTAFILSRYTHLPVVTIYIIIQASELIKCVIGFVLVKKGVWLNNIVSE